MVRSGQRRLLCKFDDLSFSENPCKNIRRELTVLWHSQHAWHKRFRVSSRIHTMLALSVSLCPAPHGQVQSTGHIHSTPLSPGSGLLWMPLTVLSLVSIINTFFLPIPWSNHVIGLYIDVGSPVDSLYTKMCSGKSWCFFCLCYG